MSGCGVAWSAPAHPRSRGENAAAWTDEVAATGSSPLTRGKHAADRGARVRDRLIPAHAGKTSTHGRVSGRWWAHPRSRGENCHRPGVPRSDLGSSPLTRGKPWAQIKAAVSVGLIPAHAGKTASASPPARGMRAHPRSRGENRACARRERQAPGSSPLTRGKRSALTCPVPSVGLIPAHAGKTICRVFALVAPGAHPRSRGENVAATVATVGGGGSSPLTRGKRRPIRRIIGMEGLIPAHAGKT